MVHRDGVLAPETTITINKTRANDAENFEELIESYNTGSRTIEDMVHELTALMTASLNVERQRHVRENMSEEELMISGACAGVDR
ncbi:MAG: hypothetical protein ABJC26_08765 [Gemmatimonadaceae bacterium]